MDTQHAQRKLQHGRDDADARTAAEHTKARGSMQEARRKHRQHAEDWALVYLLQRARKTNGQVT